MACFSILGGTLWYLSCGLWSPLPTAWSSGCSFPNLTVPPNRYTPASCSHWDFCSCSAFFFLPLLLLSHLTHKRHKSRRGSVFTARQFLQHQGWVQGNGCKTCYTPPPHTCLLANGRWAQCQRCLFILALGALICMPSMRVITVPHNTAPMTEWGLTSPYRPLRHRLQHARCWVTSLEMSLPAFWWGPSVLSLLWKRFGKELEKGWVKSKPLSQASAAMSLWKWHLLNTGMQVGAAVNKCSSPPCYSVTIASGL